MISSAKQAKGGGLTHQLSDVSRFASAGWHTDISFEPVPSDYAMLKIHTLPATGGDTLWASGYEIYDRLSPPMQQFLEGLTATHDAKFFLEEAERLGNPIRKGVRGNVLNQGEGLTAVHPVIRTNRTLIILFPTAISDTDLRQPSLDGSQYTSTRASRSESMALRKTSQMCCSAIYSTLLPRITMRK